MYQGWPWQLTTPLVHHELIGFHVVRPDPSPSFAIVDRRNVHDISRLASRVGRKNDVSPIEMESGEFRIKAHFCATPDDEQELVEARYCHGLAEGTTAEKAYHGSPQITPPT